MPEDKQVICDYLLKALSFTNYGEEYESLTYNSADESVLILFKDGFSKKVNVACDSGIAMMKDILKAVE